MRTKSQKAFQPLRKSSAIPLAFKCHDLIAVQLLGLAERDLQARLFDLSGKLVELKTIQKGQTIAYFDTQALYPGLYLLQVSAPGAEGQTYKVAVGN